MRDYGIDGFRVDTAKHVEKPTLALLKQRATAALAAWKAEHPQQALDDAPFWMTGEAWGHGVMKSDYYQNGFDAMINFDFQDQASQALGCFADIDATYRQMAERLQDFNVLSYLFTRHPAVLRQRRQRLAASPTAGGEPAVAGAGRGADLLRR